MTTGEGGINGITRWVLALVNLRMKLEFSYMPLAPLKRGTPVIKGSYKPCKQRFDDLGKDRVGRTGPVGVDRQLPIDISGTAVFP